MRKVSVLSYSFPLTEAFALPDIVWNEQQQKPHAYMNQTNT